MPDPRGGRQPWAISHLGRASSSQQQQPRLEEIQTLVEMILTRSTKKLMLTAALVLGVLYLLYRSGGGAAA